MMLVRKHDLSGPADCLPTQRQLLPVFSCNDRTRFCGVVDQSQSVFQDSHLERWVIRPAQR
jgi:hypothetical protein